MLNRTFVLVFLTIMTAVVVESFHRSPNNKDKMSYDEYLQLTTIPKFYWSEHEQVKK